MRDSISEAFQYAFRLLKYRSRSESELRTRLLQKGFSEDTAEAVIKKLKDSDIINDRKLLEELLEYGAKKKRLGRAGLYWYCKKRGIPEDLLQEIDFSMVEDLSAAQELIQRRLIQMDDLPEPAVKRRLFGLLSRRGYPAETIRTLIDRCLQEKKSISKGGNT